ncbi:MAG: hypothetical protein ABIM89_18750 [Mycobacteriales bacterium]
MTDLSRRALLGIGVAGAGALAAPAGPAAAEPPNGPPNVRRLAPSLPAVATSPLVAPRYVTYPGIALVAGTQSATTATWCVYESNPKGGAWATNNGWLGTAIEVPAGEVVVDVTAFTYGVGAGKLVLDRYLPAADGFVETITGAIAASTVAGLRTTTIPINRALAPDEALHAYVFGTSTNHVVRGMRVGYRRATSGFVPIAPYRAYDSRYLDGKLGRSSRLVPIGNSVRPPTGAVTGTDLIPAAATAISYNLGVYATESSGYLAVTPPATTRVTASSLNWFGSDQSLSNGLTAQLDGTRTLKVFAGGRGRTHFVIDVLGYYI